eukprot:4912598-Karenia_brevis.AAC.1
MEELQHELGEIAWDVALVNETWREAAAEDFTTVEGHRWIGGGGAKKRGCEACKHGVGIFLHKKWASEITGIRRYGARVLSVDLSVYGHKFRFIA